MTTIIIFIAVLAVLVLSHEAGHFFMARRAGMKVYEFGFGFPPKLGAIAKIGGKWRFVGAKADMSKAEGTFYSLNLLPLGGFVRVKGESAAEEGSQDPDSFSSKKFLPRVGVLVAGVVMNVVVAAVLLSIVFAMGISEPQEGADSRYVSDKRLEVLEVIKNTPAAAAHLIAGDIVRQVGEVKSPTVEQFKAVVSASAGQRLTLGIERQKKLYIIQVIPTIDAETKQAMLGVGIMDTALVKYPLHLAIAEGVKATFNYIELIVVGLWQFFVGLFKGAPVAGEVSGPVGVAVLTGQAARLGLVYLLHFSAILSLNLAVLNILPIPALDGGRLLFVIINAFKKKPVPPYIEQLLHNIVFILLLVLILVITVKDIRAIIGPFSSLFNRL